MKLISVLRKSIWGKMSALFSQSSFWGEDAAAFTLANFFTLLPFGPLQFGLLLRSEYRV